MVCEEWQHQLIKAIKPPDILSKLFAFKHSAYCKDKGCHYQHGMMSKLTTYPW